MVIAFKCPCVCFVGTEHTSKNGLVALDKRQNSEKENTRQEALTLAPRKGKSRSAAGAFCRELAGTCKGVVETSPERFQLGIGNSKVKLDSNAASSSDVEITPIPMRGVQSRDHYRYVGGVGDSVNSPLRALRCKWRLSQFQELVAARSRDYSIT